VRLASPPEAKLRNEGEEFEWKKWKHFIANGVIAGFGKVFLLEVLFFCVSTFLLPRACIFFNRNYKISFCKNLLGSRQRGLETCQPLLGEGASRGAQPAPRARLPAVASTGSSPRAPVASSPVCGHPGLHPAGRGERRSGCGVARLAGGWSRSQLLLSSLSPSHSRAQGTSRNK